MGEDRWRTSADALAFAASPQAHRRDTRPTERIDGETKRRSRVVGIFPNNALVRPVGAILPDVHDERVAAKRRHPSEGSVAKPCTTGDNEPVATAVGGA